MPTSGHLQDEKHNSAKFIESHQQTDSDTESHSIKLVQPACLNDLTDNEAKTSSTSLLNEYIRNFTLSREFVGRAARSGKLSMLLYKTNKPVHIQFSISII